METTGAGDAFSAGFVAEAVKRLSAAKEEEEVAGDLGRVLEAGAGGAGLREMVKFASAVGALTCTGDGAILPQPTEGDVLNLLRKEGGGAV